MPLGDPDAQIFYPVGSSQRRNTDGFSDVSSRSNSSVGVRSPRTSLGRCSKAVIGIGETISTASQLVLVARELQAEVVMRLSERGQSPLWPTCPHHPEAHSMDAHLARGRACWVCPSLGSTVVEIGQLA